MLWLPTTKTDLKGGEITMIEGFASRFRPVAALNTEEGYT